MAAARSRWVASWYSRLAASIFIGLACGPGGFQSSFTSCFMQQFVRGGIVGGAGRIDPARSRR